MTCYSSNKGDFRGITFITNILEGRKGGEKEDGLVNNV